MEHPVVVIVFDKRYFVHVTAPLHASKNLAYLNA